MNIFYRAANFAFRIVSPSFWIQNNPSCPFLDDFINDCLDKGDVEIVNAYYVKLRDRLVWVQNYPYAFGRDDRNVLPYPLTRVRLNKHITKLIYQQEK